MNFQLKPLIISSILTFWVGMFANCQAQDLFFYTNEDSPDMYGNSSGVALNVAKEGIYILERYFDLDTNMHFRVRTFDHSGQMIASKDLPRWNRAHGYDTLANGQVSYVYYRLDPYGVEANIYAHNTNEGFYLDYIPELL